MAFESHGAAFKRSRSGCYSLLFLGVLLAALPSKPNGNCLISYGGLLVVYVCGASPVFLL